MKSTLGIENLWCIAIIITMEKLESNETTATATARKKKYDDEEEIFIQISHNLNSDYATQWRK